MTTPEPLTWFDKVAAEGCEISVSQPSWPHFESAMKRQIEPYGLTIQVFGARYEGGTSFIAWKVVKRD